MGHVNGAGLFNRRLTGVALGISLLVGCAPSAPPVTLPEDQPPKNAAPVEEQAPPAALPRPIDRVAIQRVYDETAELVATYRDGLDLLRDGEEVDGETLLADAYRGLSNQFATCRELEGCDLSRVWSAGQHLLSEQNLIVKLQANELRELGECLADAPPPEAGTEVDALAAEDLAAPGEITVDPERVQMTRAMLRGTDLRDLITLNGPVMAALDDWLTWMRPQLMESYRNYVHLRDRIAPVYEEAGLPEALLFGMMATETNGRSHATSRAGARGLLQFMRYTGRKYGLKEVDGFDTRLDPVESTRANVAYVTDLLALLDNDLEKALASYNCGEGRLMRLNRRHGKQTSLWDRDFYYSLPKETREYVPRIFAAAWLFLHPEEFNLEWPTQPVDHAALVVQQETSLSELTVCFGQIDNEVGWFRALRNLNPRLEPSDRIPVGATLTVPTLLAERYPEVCAESPLLARARELQAANYPDRAEMIPYTVRRGDTLGKIANRHRCVSMRELADINGIRAPRYVISVGQRLRIPNCG